MTLSHDETLHPRDTTTGEFTTKDQSDPEIWIETPAMTSGDIEQERLEGEYSRLPDEDIDSSPEAQRRRFSLAAQITNVRVRGLGLAGSPHTLILSNENGEGGAPYWMPEQILEADGTVLWAAPPLDEDDGISDFLGAYTASLDRLGDEAVTLPDGRNGIVL